MFNLQPFLDLINSKCCTHEYYILNFSDLEKVDKTFFKNTKYQSEKNTYFFSKRIFVPMSSINLSCLRQTFRSGPLKGGLQEKMYFLLGCVRCASGEYDLNDRECDFRNLFGLLLEFILSLCLFWSACLCQTDQPRSQSRLKKAKEIM